ncbi:MAG: ATP-binding protein [Singulisphaera sp.]
MLVGPQSPISGPQVRSAMTAAVRDALGPLTIAMAGVFLFLAVCAFLLGFGALAPLLAGIEVASATLVLAIRWVALRRPLADRWVYPVLMTLACLALARCLAQLYVWNSPRDTMNLAVLIGATSLVSLSLAWSAAIVALIWAGWAVIAFYIHPENDWLHYGFVLLWTTALGAALQLARQRLQLRLVQAEARYQVLVEHLPVVSYLDDLRPGQGPIYISPQLERVLGYLPSEWQGTHDFWKSRVYPPDREQTLATMRKHVEDRTGWDLEYRMTARDGRIVWIHDRSTQIVNSAGEHLSYGIMVDVTERKRIEMVAAGGNRILKRIASGAALADVLHVIVDATQETSPGALGMILLAVDSDKLRIVAAPQISNSITHAVNGLQPDRENPFRAAVLSASPTIIDDIKTHNRWPDHRDAVVEQGLQALRVEPILSATGECLGALAMYFRQVGAARKVSSKLIQAAAGIAALAIERSRAEENLARHREQLELLVEQRTRQLEASLGQLRHAERLASVGTLAAGIAHEINNPVGMILLAAEQALLRTEGGEHRDHVALLLREIVKNSKRCGRIVKSVLRFARQEPADRWPDDINVVIQHAVDLTRNYAARSGGVIETRLSAGLPNILLNPVELEQVFVNLICNGIEAADRGASIVITSESIDSTVRVTVRDNGRGVPRGDRSRIFDPFYTTRQGNGGTGLGLSLAYGIVTDHGGTIRVESAVDGGTEMIVELPCQVHAASPVANAT